MGPNLLRQPEWLFWKVSKAYFNLNPGLPSDKRGPARDGGHINIYPLLLFSRVEWLSTLVKYCQSKYGPDVNKCLEVIKLSSSLRTHKSREDTLSIKIS